MDHDLMDAVEISVPGGPDVLKPVKTAKPVVRPDEILIEVAYAGVNRPDCLQRAGAYPPPKGASPLPGLEVSGHVVDVGDNVTRWKKGDAVCALSPGGGYARFCAVPAGHALPIPDGFDLVQAAALPETYFTVWHNVFQRGGLRSGETLLVHGGTSGIGTTAIQLGKAFGAHVIVTAGSPDKCEAARDIGADVAINYRERDFVEAVLEATGGKGADVILDMVGGAYTERNYRAAAMDGRIVQIAFLGGAKAEVNFTLLMMKRLTHTGSTLRARDDAFKTALAAELEAKVWPLLAKGEVAPIMDRVFPLAEAAGAHARMEAGDHVGKIMLKV